MEDFGLRLSSPKTRETARFDLDPSLCAADPIVLVVRHAGRGNDEFTSMVTKQAKARANAADETPAQRQLAREEDAELFARTVVVGWEGVPGEFTPDRALAFFRYLIQPRRSGEHDADYAFRLAEFDRLKLFCLSFGTFRGSAEDLGKG